MYYKNKFLETFKKLCETRASWQVWADFVTATACALANTVDKGEHYKEREKEYIECAKRTIPLAVLSREFLKGRVRFSDLSCKATMLEWI